MKKVAIYDTRDGAKRHFGFTSNKMDDIARLMGIETKIPIHFETWEGCEEGDPKAWKLMKKYNANDVSPMLEDIYTTFRAWDHSHPNLNVIQNVGTVACPSCGCSDYTRKGWNYTTTGRRPDLKCGACGRRYVGRHQKITEYR
jgi:hypothetical protein